MMRSPSQQDVPVFTQKRIIIISRKFALPLVVYLDSTSWASLASWTASYVSTRDKKSRMYGMYNQQTDRYTMASRKMLDAHE